MIIAGLNGIVVINCEYNSQHLDLDLNFILTIIGLTLTGGATRRLIVLRSAGLAIPATTGLAVLASIAGLVAVATVLISAALTLSSTLVLALVLSSAVSLILLISTVSSRLGLLTALGPLISAWAGKV